MNLWGIFFTFLTTIPLIFCGQCLLIMALTLAVLFGQKVYFVYFFPVVVVAVRSYVHCYFISILPHLPLPLWLSGTGTVLDIASHDCVLCEWTTTTAACNVWLQIDERDGHSNGKRKKTNDRMRFLFLFIVGLKERCQAEKNDEGTAAI